MSHDAENGHAWSKMAIATKAATCTEDGYTKHSCTNGCGAFNDVVIPALGHNWVFDATTLSASCKNCGAAADLTFSATGINIEQTKKNSPLATKFIQGTGLSPVLFSCAWVSRAAIVRLRKTSRHL
jgi:hypothetical protein